VVRRSLKEDKRLQAERRGEMDLRMAKWEVGLLSGMGPFSGVERGVDAGG
jgi:F-type H+-transporting ATPase subunit epsilon